MKKRISIYVHECKTGMIIAQNVFNDYGAVIVGENSIIDDNVIQKLEVFGIDKVLIYDESQEKTDKKKVTKDKDTQIKKEEFKKEYKENVDTLKNVLKDISSGKNLDKKRIDNIVDIVLQNKLPTGDIMSCINEVRNVDEYTYTHSVNVAILCMMIGRWLKYDEKVVRDLVYAGLLHDIGKAKVDLAILNKPGKLTNEEYDEIKKHVIYGYRIIEKMPDINQNIASAVLMHHERADGSGYIIGTIGDEVHEYAKIVATADVFDAMTANRVYRKKISPFEVFEHMQNEVFGKFDPKVTLEFLSHMAEYYVGDKCRLNTGQEGEIIKINPNAISRPLVKVDDEYIDLSRHFDIKIEEVL